MILTPLFTLSLLLRLLLSSLSLSHFQLHHPFNSVGKNMDHCNNRSSSWNDGPMQLSPNHLADDDNNSNNDDNVEDAVKLLSAPHEGLSAEYVLSILSKNPRLIRFADPVGDNVLHMSARNGDTETVCKLIAFLEERQDEDLKKVLTDVNVNGDTPLHLALMNGHHEISNHLGRANTDAIVMRNNDGTIPFELAEKAGYSEYPWSYYSAHHVEHSSATVKDLTTVSRIFPVHWIELQRAIEKDEEDNLFTGLLRHGKKLLWHHGRGGETLLHKAVRASGMGPLSKLVQFMISNGMTDVAFLKDSYENTALHVAVENKELNKARCLIKAEPRTVYQVNHKGVSPLYIAVKDGHTDLVEYMMNDDGLCISASDILWHPKHATLAHLAIRTRSFGILKTLMEHLPELANLIDEKGWRPLSYAASKGYLDEVTYLLTNFPESAETYDKDGSLPIHKAVGGGHVNIIDAFYKHCPQSLHHVDRKGRNALEIALSYDRADIYTFLTNLVQLVPTNLGHNGENNSDDDMSEIGEYLLCALHEGISADGILSILSNNPRLIRIANPMGDNVLHMSARNGDIATVDKLIAFLNERRDRDLEAVFMDTNVNEDTPLHLAIKNGHREASYQLVRAKSIAGDIRNNDGITSFELAEQAGYSDILKCRRSTRVSKADVQMRAIAKDFTNASREFPMHWIELKRTIDKGQEEDLITGLTRDGKNLLRHQDRGGKTLLHAAVTASGVGPVREIVRFMVSNDMTDAALLRDGLGNTPLHLAVENKELSKACCLIKTEPRAVYQVDNVGISPLYIAVKDGQHDLVKYMVSHLCPCVPASDILWHPTHATLAHLAVKTRSFGILETLMEYLPELIKSTNDKGWRPLSYAANKGNVEGVTYFLTNFPESANKHDEDGSFPIHKAVGGGHLSVIKAFYEICPQALHHIDRKGRSVLHIAVSYDRANIYTYLTKELKLDDFFSSLQNNEGKTFKDYEQKLKI